MRTFNTIAISEARQLAKEELKTNYVVFKGINRLYSHLYLTALFTCRKGCKSLNYHEAEPENRASILIQDNQ